MSFDDQRSVKYGSIEYIKNAERDEGEKREKKRERERENIKMVIQDVSVYVACYITQVSQKW